MLCLSGFELYSRWVPLLYLYLYTDYYSVYRTFICIAHLPFQLLSFRNLCGDYKLEFMERKL